MFAFMTKSDDKDVNEKVNLADFKKNVNVFSIRKLRNLLVVLIDSISELTIEMDLFNNILDIFQYEKLVMVTEISNIEKQMFVLESENVELKEKIKIVTITISKRSVTLLK